LARLEAEAHRRGIPACVMTFEPHPREFFAPDQAPTRLTSLREKLELLASFAVDRVQLVRFNYDFAKITAEEFLVRILVRGLGVRWMLVGDDFRFGARRAGDREMLEREAPRHGFEVAEMESFTLEGLRVSSTAVRGALAAGDLTLAARLLGRPYGISGRVVGGDRLGKKIGFPTANIQLKHNKPPVAGIFVVQVRGLGDTALPGVASLGTRPTLHPDGKPTLEVHLFDFTRDIYGAHLRVDFLAKLRDEEKYPDLGALTRQIGRDVENARRYFLDAEAPGSRIEDRGSRIEK
ncbi:MAG TPA: bifunctional riboflavin kinase/FAD synthetase, partial [Burkholderiales bacterium]